MDKKLTGWFLVAVTEDGPSRIQGTVTYSTEIAAINGAREFLAQLGPSVTICVCQAGCHLWVDPVVRIITDAPEATP